VGNALSHGYADLDLGTVWNTAQTNLPELERQLLAFDAVSRPVRSPSE
jgi:uncharacterized protein with HEPN domain